MITMHINPKCGNTIHFLRMVYRLRNYNTYECSYRVVWGPGQREYIIRDTIKHKSNPKTKPMVCAVVTGGDINGNHT